MLLTIAIIVVVVLAVALLPMKKRERNQASFAGRFPNPEPAQPVRQTTLRQQQLDEEATAVASSINAALMRFGSMKCGRRPRSCSWGTTMIGWLCFISCR